MGRLRKKRMHKDLKHIRKKYRTRRRTKDLDQVVEDLQPEKVMALVHFPVDGDLPGLGQFYCIHCTRHFSDDECFQAHLRSKDHKKRMKLLSEAPYTQAEADAAGGLGSYRPPAPIALPSMADLHVLRTDADAAAVAATGEAAPQHEQEQQAEEEEQPLAQAQQI